MTSCITILSGLGRFLEVIAQLVAACGVVLALVKWKRTIRQNRSDNLQSLLERFNKDKLIQKVTSEDSILETWEELGIEQQQQRQFVEKTLEIVAFLCYLRANKLIEQEDFILFKDTMDRLFATPPIAEFLHDEYNRYGEKDEKGRYHYLFKYLENQNRPIPSITKTGPAPVLAAKKTSKEVSEVDFTEPTMIIKINRAYKEGMSDNEILEATRKWWRINPDKANKTLLILAVASGVVKAAFRRNGFWQKDLTGEHGGRYCFSGTSAEDSQAKAFIGKSVAGLFPKGASNPIRYFSIP